MQDIMTLEWWSGILLICISEQKCEPIFLFMINLVSIIMKLMGIKLILIFLFSLPPLSHAFCCHLCKGTQCCSIDNFQSSLSIIYSFSIIFVLLHIKDEYLRKFWFINSLINTEFILVINLLSLSLFDRRIVCMYI